MNDDEERGEVVYGMRMPGGYNDPTTRSTVGFSVPIRTATEQDIKMFSEAKAVCGECHHFLSTEEHHTAELLAQGRLLAKLVDEYEWKLHHAFPGGPENAGLCDAHGYLTQCFAAAKDCAFTPARGKVRRKASESELYQIGTDKQVALDKQRKRDQQFRARISYNPRIREKAGADK